MVPMSMQMASGMGLLAIAAILVVTVVVCFFGTATQWHKWGVLCFLGIAVSFAAVVAVASPGGEARTTIEDGSYAVMSAVRTDEAKDGREAAFYNMLLIAGGEARYYRISHDVLEVDNDSKDSKLRTLTVVSKQGLRKATLHYPFGG